MNNEICNQVVRLWNEDTPVSKIIELIPEVRSKSQVSTIITYSRVRWASTAKARHFKTIEISTVVAYYLRGKGLSYSEIKSLVDKHGLSRSNGALRTALTSRKGKTIEFEDCSMRYEDGEVFFEGDILKLLDRNGLERLATDITTTVELKTKLGETINDRVNTSESPC